MADTGESLLTAMLRKAQLRVTSHRLAILRILSVAGQPLTRQEIAECLDTPCPDKVTIYRTLQTLINAGLVHKAFLQHRTWHFELAHNCTDNQCHPHFSCTSCGRTHCMVGIPVPMTTRWQGYVIEHQRVQLEGLCPDCNHALSS
jgi:Fe2+ or Zn2+ uptake regulation protein